MPRFRSLAFAALPVLAACEATGEARVLRTSSALPLGAEACSTFGQPLYPPPLSGAELAKRQAALHEAVAAWEKAPHDADATLWVGRRLGYLGRFREAIEVFSIGAREHPDDPRFLRHRGHRRITVRDFDGAAEDLERAAELVRERPDETEPDGQPNARGIPLETLKSNVYYHLGLAHFLRGDFESALPAWEKCLANSPNPDNKCSASHWLYMTLRRLGRASEAADVVAAIQPDFEIVEYHSYHQLCLAYRGDADMEALYEAARAKGPSSTDFATVGFGAANWHLVNGRPARARAILQEVMTSPAWHAFGRIAAEVELARMP